MISSILWGIWKIFHWIRLSSYYSTSSLIIVVVCCAVFFKLLFDDCPIGEFVWMHGRKKVSTTLFNVAICYTNDNYVDILTEGRGFEPPEDLHPR